MLCVSAEPLPRAWHLDKLIKWCFCPRWDHSWLTGVDVGHITLHLVNTSHYRSPVTVTSRAHIQRSFLCICNALPDGLFLHWSPWWIQLSHVTLPGAPLPCDKCKKNFAFLCD